LWPKRLLENLLHPNPTERPLSWKTVLEELSSKGEINNKLSEALKEIKDVHGGIKNVQEGIKNVRLDIKDVKEAVNNVKKAVIEIPQKVLDVKNISCPFLFQFIPEDEFKSFKRGEESPTDYLSFAEKISSDAKNWCQKLNKLIVDKDYSETIKYSVAQKEVIYLQILCGLTFKPVLSYKVIKSQYPEWAKRAADKGATICNTLQNLSFVWKTVAILGKVATGMSIPDPEDALKKTQDFLSSIQDSSSSAQFINKLDRNGGGFENAQDMHDFKTFLDNLEKKGNLRHCQDKKSKGGKAIDDSWKNVMIQKYIVHNDENIVTWVSKANTDAIYRYPQEET